MNALKCRTLGIFESARARSLITLTGSIRKTLDKRRRLNRKKLATLHRVVSQVEFSLVLAFLEPLEGSAVQKSVRNVTAVPYNTGSGVSLQRSGFREIPTNFSTSVREKIPTNFSTSVRGEM